MKDDGYPQDISPDESELKFKKFLIDGIGPWKDGVMLPQAVPVVARILSLSDILVKIWDPTGLVRYLHCRWGYSKSLGSQEYCGWHYMSPPTPDAKQLVYDFSFGAHEEKQDVAGVPFTYRAA